MSNRKPKYLPGIGKTPGLVRELKFGTFRCYYRPAHGDRISLKDANGKWYEWGSPALAEAYKAARWGRPVAPVAQAPDAADTKSLAWLVEQYRASHQFRAKAEKTQFNIASLLKRLVAKNGHYPFADITTVHLADLKDEIARTQPQTANKLIGALKELFGWAASNKDGRTPLRRDNPALLLERVEHTSVSHHSWTEAEEAQFVARWPLGTPQHLAFVLLRYTGQRGASDVTRMGQPLVGKDGCIHLTQKKTGKPVVIAIVPEIRAAIDAAAVVGADTWLVTDSGKAFTQDSFVRWFRKACDEAGLPHCSAHGIRHAASARCLEAGADLGYLMNQFGYTPGTAQTYLSNANKAKIAKQGARFISPKAAAKA